MPNPLTALGRVLSKRKEKKTETEVVSPQREQLLQRVAGLRDPVARLPFPGMQGLLGGGLDTVVQQEGGLDALTEQSARSGKLMQLIGVVDGIESRLALLDGPIEDHRQLLASIALARNAMKPMTDGTELGRLEGKLGVVERGVGLAIASANPKDLEALKALQVPVRAVREDVDKALHQQRLDQARLKVEGELPALKLRIEAARKFDASSPTMKLRIKALNDLEAEIGRATTAGEHLQAEGQLPALTRAVGEAETLEAQEAKAYTDALNAATQQHAALSAPVVAPDAAKFKADYLDEPARLVTAGDRLGAMARLAQATVAHDRIAADASDYADKLAAAKQALNLARATMVPLDIEKVENEMIQPAEVQAGIGARLAALELLSHVDAHCRLSQRANLKTFRVQGNWSVERLSKPLADLKSHAMAAMFSAEILVLERRLDRVRRNVAEGLTTRKVDPNDPSKTLDSFAEKEMLDLYWAAMKQKGYADEHASYDAKLKACELKLKELREAEPTASNSVLTEQLKALQEGIDKAGRQAAKRTYDVAEITLKKVETDTATALAFKQAHAAYVTQLALLEPRVTSAPDAPGTPSAAEAQALRTLLGQAKSLADTKHDYAAANAVLKQLATACDASAEFDKTAAQDKEAAAKALAGVDTDPGAALAEVRQLLQALKTRPGHEGIAKQLQSIETVIGQADIALKA